MEANATPNDEDEYVLLDLDGVSGLIDIPPNANYVLKGLDTLSPVLIIDDRFKLDYEDNYDAEFQRGKMTIVVNCGSWKIAIGEYEETIGTCIAFSEQDAPVAHEETGPSKTNLFSGTRLIDSNQPPTKQVKPVCQLHKVLKFKLSPDSEIHTAEEAN